MIAIDLCKSPGIMKPEDRYYLTSVKCISSAGETILSILLIFKVNILYKWCKPKDLDGNIVIGITETVYVNNVTTVKWLHYLIDYSQNKKWNA